VDPLMIAGQHRLSKGVDVISKSHG
jgi:hypothetical protein